MFDVPALLKRASRSREAQRALGRSEFDREAAALSAKAAINGGHGSSSYRQAMCELCASELHKRTVADVIGLVSAHKSMHAPPHAFVGCKNWIAKRIAEDALDLTRHLWKPREAFGERGEPDSLMDAAHREQESAYAALDSASDELTRNRVERAIRFVTRAWAFVVKPFRVIFGAG